MSEPIESVRVGDRATTPVHSASVRELLTELAELEDATRGPGGFAGPAGTVQPTDLLAALAREQEIIDELHARCPETQLSTSHLDVQGRAARAD